MNKEWAIHWLAGVLLIAAVLGPRVFDLGQFLTADERRWLANTAGFTEKLAHGQWGQLLQQPHPGITTQWLGALAVRSPDWAVRKLPLVLGQSVLVLVVGYIFGRLWGKSAGIVLTVILALNPVLIAHTRVYAMDSLMALFTLLSLGCLLLWRAEGSNRYLVFSAAAAAAAVLSKLPAVLLLPFIVFVFLVWAMRDKNREWWLRGLFLWAGICAVALIVILPSFLSQKTSVIGDFQEFFRSGDYQELHQEGPYYYVRSLVFFSTPLQMVAVGLLPVILLGQKGRFLQSRMTREQLAILLLFVALFVVQMSIGAKKGDRYILPVFLILDVLAAIVLAFILAQKNKGYALLVTRYSLLALLLWQAIDIARLHPYTLAYVNPITKAFYGDRRLGWGEGLDLAAEYLNDKAGGRRLKVASYYPNEFAYRFHGEVVPAHQYDGDSVDYVVTYRAMLERGAEAWETDVLEHYRDVVPEKVIELNGLPYAWIYAK